MNTEGYDNFWAKRGYDKYGPDSIKLRTPSLPFPSLHIPPSLLPFPSTPPLPFPLPFPPPLPWNVISNRKGAARYDNSLRVFKVVDNIRFEHIIVDGWEEGEIVDNGIRFEHKGKGRG